MRRATRWGFGTLVALIFAGRLTAGGPDLTPNQVAALLASMHPDYTRYIREVRFGDSRMRPSTLYAGLVRRGGEDPRDPADGPTIGRGASNDLIVYADTFEPWRTDAWRRLVTDHEYFHARHFAKGFNLPTVGFGLRQTDTDYYEAMAWGYVLERAGEGAYGKLAAGERAEAAARYQEHYDGFRRFVMRVQPSAWAHYGRFLPEPGGCPAKPAASTRTKATSPAAAPATR